MEMEIEIEQETEVERARFYLGYLLEPADPLACLAGGMGATFVAIFAVQLVAAKPLVALYALAYASRELQSFSLRSGPYTKVLSFFQNSLAFTNFRPQIQLF